MSVPTTHRDTGGARPIDASTTSSRRPPRERPAKAQVMATAVLAALGAVFFALSFAYPWTLEDGSIGPGVLPRTASALLALVSLARLVLQLRGSRAAPGQQLPGDGEGTDAAGAATPAGVAAEQATAEEVAAEAVAAEDLAAVEEVEEVPHARRKLLLVCATVLLTALLVPYLGLLLALGLMTLFLAAVVERQPLVRSLLVAGGTLAVSYLVFVTLLSIPLPMGLLDPALWRQ
ncbi:tripartite tricarboxylate transporter TctB family protein [Kineococcus sp. SYSU DK006]|uniref:tripartite tricarboxylate transporter TctB family protein n=1 Tax=Kineococcus sp. SYSU DK006 TaxID=3383127 RepID=UPI003D7DECEA